MFQFFAGAIVGLGCFAISFWVPKSGICLLYTSDAADEL